MLSDRERPGGDIFIHGKAVTIGCLPIGDAAIEELYLAALDTRDAGHPDIPVHIFPARMSGESWEAFLRAETESRTELADFWEQLAPAFLAFEKTRRIPSVRVDGSGRYVTDTLAAE
jgi:murein L,D-transpeptidase YafK